MQNETSQRVFIKFEKVSTIWNNLSLNNHHATYLTIGCLNTTKIYKTLVHIQNNFYSLKRRHTANQKKLENTLLVSILYIFIMRFSGEILQAFIIRDIMCVNTNLYYFVHSFIF